MAKWQWLAAAALATGGSAAQACDLELDAFQNYMNDVDLVGMSYPQQVETRRLAIQAFHDARLREEEEAASGHGQDEADRARTTLAHAD